MEEDDDYVEKDPNEGVLSLDDEDETRESVED